MAQLIIFDQALMNKRIFTGTFTLWTKNISFFLCEFTGVMLILFASPHANLNVPRYHGLFNDKSASVINPLCLSFKIREIERHLQFKLFRWRFSSLFPKQSTEIYDFGGPTLKKAKKVKFWHEVSLEILEDDVDFHDWSSLQGRLSSLRKFRSRKNNVACSDWPRHLYEKGSSFFVQKILLISVRNSSALRTVFTKKSLFFLRMNRKKDAARSDKKEVVPRVH